jgi:hypothetical protein
MHFGHAAFDNFTPNGPTIEHSPAAADSSVEQPAVIAADPDTEPVVVEGNKNEGGSLGGQIPDAGIAADPDAEPVVVEDGKKEVEPQAAAAQQPAAAETGAKPEITPQMKEELAEGTQKWAKAIGGWWNHLVASQQQNGENQAAAPAVPVATTAEPQNLFFTEVNQQRAGVDITPNIHDGSSTLPAAEAATPAVPAATTAEPQNPFYAEVSEQRARADISANANNGSSTLPAAEAAAPAAQVAEQDAVPMQVSGEKAQDAATATVVSAGPVVEQAPQAVEVVEFDSDNIWAEAAEITGGDGKRTDFLKDVGVMFDHAGAGNHEHKMGDTVIVIPDSVNTAVDLQKLHDLHPEAVGFTSSDESLRRLDTFYQEALNTAPEQRNALQQDVMEHFTGGMSGADLAENPEAVEAMLKIAHGETVDGSKHIIGDAAGQPNKQTP